MSPPPRNALRRRRPPLTQAGLRTLYDESPIGIAELSVDGRFTSANKALQRMLARPERELCRLTFQEVTHPDDVAGCVKDFGLLVAGESDHFEMEKRFLRKDGGVVWAHAIVTAVRSGRSRGMICMAIDVTESRRAQDELMRLKAGLEDRVKERTAALREKNEALERSNSELEIYAYAASHDLSAPLRKIIAFGDLLEGRAQGKLDAVELDYLARMRRAAAAALKLVGDMLTLSRVGRAPHHLEEIDLNALLEEVKGELGSELEGGRVEAGRLPVLRAHFALLHALMLNLLSNCAKFRSPDRPLVVRVDARREGEEVVLAVRDNGIGFGTEYAEKIFLPFLRLHAASDYEGSGIGLAICRRVSARYGGSIAAESEPGLGSTFTLRLPAAMVVADGR